jgi:Na+-translocating ferredoxin:NAD+ oxidoreductase RNF subunit RnfB
VAIPSAVPLYRCSDCGFVTTASHANAIAAHEEALPRCDGRLDVVADFKRPPAVMASPATRRRGAQGPLSGRERTERRA